ncbi:MAG: serine hydrolase domain-containing protein [Pseudomonadota bacterium]
MRVAKTFKALLALCQIAFLSETAFSRTEFDSREIEAWADEYFGTALENKQMTGASVGFIQDDEILFLKGYGWEDQKAQIPLDPRQTRFRMCSTSKTVTATSVMQLVERGAIDSLDDPVNNYLQRYKLPPPYGDQVTFRHLMTHSSGMAGHFTPQGTKKDLPVPVSAEIVRDFFRENIERPPGFVGVYANLGAALEGVVVEDVSEQSFAAYVAQNIFEPLGMSSALIHHSTEEPPHLAQPYAIYPDGSLQAIPFYPKHPLTAASGGFITTTEDMLKYVALHADEEARTRDRVLSGEGRKLLHARHFGRHPSDPGIGLHFYRDRYGDELMVHHGCGLPGTRSLMGVFPASQAGFVVTVLTADVSPSVGDLIGKLFGTGRLIDTGEGPTGEAVDANALPSALLGQLRRPDIITEGAPSGMVDDVNKLTGTYWGERRSFRSFATIFAFDTTTVAVGDRDGEIKIDDKLYRRQAPGVFDSEEGVRRVFFRQMDEEGEVFLQPHVSLASRHVKGLKNPVLAYLGMAVSFGISLTGFFALFWRSLPGRRHWAKWLSVGMAGCVVLLPLAFLLGYERVTDIAFVDYLNGDVTRATVFIMLFNIYALLGAGVVISAVLAWRRHVGDSGVAGVFMRGHLSLMALAAVASWPGMVLFNLLGLQY